MRSLKTYREDAKKLNARQERDTRALATRQKIQAQDVARREAALEKVERRELAAFMRDQRTAQRVRDPGGEAAMPSLADIAGIDARREPGPAIDLLGAFARAGSSGVRNPRPAASLYTRGRIEGNAQDAGTAG